MAIFYIVCQELKYVIVAPKPLVCVLDCPTCIIHFFCQKVRKRPKPKRPSRAHSGISRPERYALLLFAYKITQPLVYIQSPEITISWNIFQAMHDRLFWGKSQFSPEIPWHGICNLGDLPSMKYANDWAHIYRQKSYLDNDDNDASFCWEVGNAWTILFTRTLLLKLISDNSTTDFMFQHDLFFILFYCRFTVNRSDDLRQLVELQAKLLWRNSRNFHHHHEVEELQVHHRNLVCVCLLLNSYSSDENSQYIYTYTIVLVLNHDGKRNHLLLGSV